MKYALMIAGVLIFFAGFVVNATEISTSARALGVVLLIVGGLMMFGGYRMEQSDRDQEIEDCLASGGTPDRHRFGVSCYHDGELG